VFSGTLGPILVPVAGLFAARLRACYSIRGNAVEIGGRMSVIANWLEALRTTNIREGATLDPVSRWLLITRASVFPMTFFSAAIGGLLAVPSGQAHAGFWLLSALGLVLAHAANNMINDYFDLASGVDTPDYARALYAPHPILSGLISKRGLLGAIGLVNLIGAGIAAYLMTVRGWPVAAFALAGFGISLFYVAPPLRLKHHGLGEPSIFVVWGPLMIAGTYYVTTGSLAPWVWAASVPYGLLVTTVLFGKHIDKIESDRAKSIYTVPVLLGERAARRAAQGLILGFYGIVGLEVAMGILPIWTLLVFGSAARLYQVLGIFNRPRPDEPPENYPVWPLWYVSAAFVLTRQAGALFAGGLVLDAIL
jgi:1,4-dihydroxy-2-naphthoate octaprenyltransferase